MFTSLGMERWASEEEDRPKPPLLPPFPFENTQKSVQGIESKG